MRSGRLRSVTRLIATVEEARSAKKDALEQLLADEVIRRNPRLYYGYSDDAVRFVRNTRGSSKWDLLLAAEAWGLVPQGTYLYPGEGGRPARRR
jgi:hypothetical protein